MNIVQIEGVTLHLAHPDELLFVGSVRKKSCANCWPRG